MSRNPIRPTAATLEWKCRDRTLHPGERPLVMGILNVTPDSFSDGGRYVDPQVAARRGLEMAAEGADIIDVGGESTRPGAAPVAEEEEKARVLPVIERLRAERDLCISIDTSKAAVAEAALAVGARIVNDVTAFTGDEGMIEVARQTGAGVVLMHMQGSPRTMQAAPSYGNVVQEVTRFLGRRVEALCASGIDRACLALDPGIGFGKGLAHNLDLLAGLRALGRHGRPVVVGLSRKSFLGKLTGRETGERLAGSLAALVYCLLNGAQGVRVHDVRESVDAVQVVAALAAAQRGEQRGLE